VKTPPPPPPGDKRTESKGKTVKQSSVTNRFKYLGKPWKLPTSRGRVALPVPDSQSQELRLTVTINTVFGLSHSVYDFNGSCHLFSLALFLSHTETRIARGSNENLELELEQEQNNGASSRVSRFSFFVPGKNSAHDVLARFSISFSFPFCYFSSFLSQLFLRFFLLSFYFSFLFFFFFSFSFC
jgi:hypothetical protein